MGPEENEKKKIIISQSAISLEARSALTHSFFYNSLSQDDQEKHKRFVTYFTLAALATATFAVVYPQLNTIGHFVTQTAVPWVTKTALPAMLAASKKVIVCKVVGVCLAVAGWQIALAAAALTVVAAFVSQRVKKPTPAQQQTSAQKPTPDKSSTWWYTPLANFLGMDTLNCPDAITENEAENHFDQNGVYNQKQFKHL
jgi:hypothetical protein